jgi:hypothetical protein
VERGSRTRSNQEINSEDGGKGATTALSGLYRRHSNVGSGGILPSATRQKGARGGGGGWALTGGRHPNRQWPKTGGRGQPVCLGVRSGRGWDADAWDPNTVPSASLKGFTVFQAGQTCSNEFEFNPKSVQILFAPNRTFPRSKN